jgi:hypothetical protein
MKSFTLCILICLLLSACTKEKEPEPQTSVVGVRPKEAKTPVISSRFKKGQAVTMKQGDSIQKAGTSFERSGSKTRQRSDSHEKSLSQKTRQFDRDMRRQTTDSQRMTKQKDRMYEKSSRTLNNEMKLKQSKIQHTTTKPPPSTI